jgi:hypothetical protein
MSIDFLLNEHDKAITIKQDLVRLAQDNVLSCQRALQTSLMTHYRENSDEIVEFDLLKETFPHDVFKNFVMQIGKCNGIKGEELTKNVLAIFERSQDKVELEKLTTIVNKFFVELSDADKLRTSLFCGGFDTLAKKYGIMSDFLQEKYSLSCGFSKGEKNFISIEGYDFSLFESSIRFTGHKDCLDGLVDVANSLVSIVNDGYQSEFIDVFEHTLSEFNSITISVKDSDGDIVTPTLNIGDYNQYVGQGDTVEDQMLDVLKMVVKEHWYSRD